MINLEKILNEYDQIVNYRINKIEKESFELFFVHDKLETVRNANTLETKVVIYVNHKKFTGNAEFSVFSAYDENEIHQRIQKAIGEALAVKNKAYSFPKNETLEVEIPSNISEQSPQALANKIHDIIVSATEKTKAVINATEIFVTKQRYSVKTKMNIDKVQTSYSIMVEAIPTFNGKKESVELYKAYKLAHFNELQFRNDILIALKDVSARSKAKKPSEEIQANIIIRIDEVKQMIHEIVDDQNYASLYSESNIFKQGELIQKEGEHDLLNVTVVPFIKKTSYGSIFDDDGVTLKKQQILKDGIFVGSYGSNQYAKYLKKKVTGKVGCVEAKKGSLSYSQMKKEPYLECASFSGLQIDIANDYIGGEVRLAYYYDGKKTKPVTGISISGKFSDVLNQLRLSTKLESSTSYYGPNYALLKGMKIF